MPDDKFPDKKKGVISKEEQDLWDEVAKTVTPLKKDSATSTKKTPTPETIKKLLIRRAPAPAQIPKSASSPATNQEISRRLRRKQLTIEARLDLHGMTLDEAWHAMHSFLERAHQTKKRCLLVITGKGKRGEVRLKQQVPQWLDADHIRSKLIGYSAARPEDGGTGAYYILLKRQRDN